MLGVKQEALAAELGEDWTQKRVSVLEQKEEIEPEVLEHVAKILKVPGDAIRNFNDEAAINIISNTFSDFKDSAVASAMNYHCNFNPMDKIVQLYDEKVALLERLLESEREKTKLMKEK